jgi:hypothetical protein
MVTITKVSREVSKTIFLETYVPGKRGAITARALYEAQVETEAEARAMSIALNECADKDVTDYLVREITKLA